MGTSRIRSFPILLRKHRWISFLAATVVSVSLFATFLSIDSFGNVGAIVLILVGCAYFLFLNWILVDGKPKPDGEIDDVGDIVSAAKSVARQYDDEQKTTFSAPLDLPADRWHSFGSDVEGKLLSRYPSNSNTTVLVTSELTFRLVRSRQQVLITVAKSELTDTSTLDLEARRQITITIRRLLRHRKSITRLPYLVALPLFLIALVCNMNEDLAAIMIMILFLFLMYRLTNKVSGEQSKNLEAFPANELSGLLSDLSKFTETDLGS
jgi:4-hydroxybenzoate polyprenyltransferase